MSKRDYVSKKTPYLNGRSTKKNIDVRRGMVFMFNVHSAIDKFNVPEIELGGVRYHDTIEYEIRPWLVVSVDFKNKKGDNVTIVPIHSGRIYDRDPTHVNITYNDQDNTVLCDQPVSINAGRLDFEKQKESVSEIDMVRVAEGLSVYLGLKTPINYLTNSHLNVLEDTFNNIIDVSLSKELDKFDLYLKEVIPELVNKRVKELLISQAPSKKEKKSKQSENLKSKKSYTRWTEDSAMEFIIDCESLPKSEVMKKYGYATLATVSNTEKRLRVRFGL